LLIGQAEMIRGFQGFVMAIGLGALTGILMTAYFLGPVFIANSGRVDVEAMMAPLVLVYALVTSAAAGLIAMVLPRTSLRGSDSFFVLLGAAVLVQLALTLTTLPGWFGATLFAMTIPATVLICSPWFRAKFE
jgi:hypothetical protein